MAETYIFPCVFTYEEEQINVSFPDLPGCFSYGNTEKEAFYNAKEALEGYLYLSELEKEDIPKPSELSSLSLDENELVTLVRIWMAPVRDEMENKTIKKTLTIPKWVNDLGLKNKINFSRLLTVSVKKYLDV